tara:strand:- start:2769 stop:3620 length:852 start_codon:yes stop_codon:yes gene_type:complete
MKLTKSRSIVNFLGIPLIVFLVFMGEYFFLFFISVVNFFCLREFYLLPRSEKIYPQFIIGYIISFLILFLNFFQYDKIIFFTFFDFFIICILLIIIFELFRGKKNPFLNISITLTGLLYVPTFLSSLFLIRNFESQSQNFYNLGMVITFVIFLSTWFCDTGALFFGKFLGKNKLLYRVSPNKTIEGSIGGFFGTFLIYILFYFFSFDEIFNEYINHFDILFIFIIIAIGAQIGDLAESLFKRNFGLKDSSSLLAGHGGFLDRFDSILFSAPLVYIYFRFFIIV